VNSDLIEVVGVDNLSTGRLENIEHIKDKMDLKLWDLRDRTCCDELCKGVDVICHQAALPSVPRSISFPEATNANNVTATVNLLKAAVDNGVKRFIYAGSSSAYGDTPTLPKVETMIPNPKSPYAVSKLAGEYYLRAFSNSYGIDCITLRYFNCVGPRQRSDSSYAGVMPKFMSAATIDGKVTVYGDGEQSRDFCPVKNVVQANLSAIFSKNKFTGEAVNIACGKRTTVNELVDMISEVSGKTLKPTHVPDRVGDVKHSLADITLARKLLGYEPLYNLIDVIPECFEYYKEETKKIKTGDAAASRKQ
jgi:nucleoside-diphosphate-sugar epimerase